MKYRAIMADLDGTVVDSPVQKTASKRTAAAIASLETQNIAVAAVTGRPASFAKPVLESGGFVSPCIVAGGTKIIDPRTYELLWACFIQPDALQQVRVLCEELPYGFLWNDYEEKDYENGGWKLEKLGLEEAVHFFEICYVPEAQAKVLADKLSTIKGATATVVTAHRKGTRDIHVTNAAATKEHAIYEFGKRLGIKKTEMIGVGDGHNDLHLFAAVGHKVAMGNAVSDLKDASDEIIGPVQEDSFAVYLEKLVKETV